MRNLNEKYELLLLRRKSSQKIWNISIDIVEWKQKYVPVCDFFCSISNQYDQYKELKKLIEQSHEEMLNFVNQQRQIGGQIDIEQLQRLIQEKDDLFWDEFNASVEMVDLFYHTKVRNMKETFVALTNHLSNLQLIDGYIPPQFRNKHNRSALERELGDLGFVPRRSAVRSDSQQDVGLNVPIILPTPSEKHGDSKTNNESLSLQTLTEAHPQPIDENTPLIIEIHVNAKSQDRQLNKEQSRAAFADFYFGLNLLHDYVTLNSEAIRKLLKRRDKWIAIHISQTRISKHHYIDHVLKPNHAFYTHKELNILESETEYIFAMAFTKGNRTKAMKQLRVPGGKASVEIPLLRLGLNLGMAIILLLTLLYIYFSAKTHFIQFDSIVIIYRMVGMLILMMWSWGLDMYVWDSYRINYVAMLDFNVRYHTRYQHMLEAASIFTLVWCVNFFFYLVGGSEDSLLKEFFWVQFLRWLPHQIYPVLLLSACIIIFAYSQFTSDFWLLKVLYRVIRAPFVHIEFEDYFLSEQLLSIVIVLTDLEFSLCYFVHDAWSKASFCHEHMIEIKPIFAILPASWRCLQSLRKYKDDNSPDAYLFLVSAIKDCTSLFVIAFSTIRAIYPNMLVWTVLWLCMVIIGTLSHFTWDVAIDWGLNPFNLRSDRLFSTQFYYFAIVTNLIARLSWTLTISPNSLKLVSFFHPVVFSATIAAIEIARRCQWNILRMENAQRLSIKEQLPPDVK